jgi:hypothetical protein
MIPDYQTLLMAVVFASQIFVLSFYTPIRWQQYHEHLLQNRDLNMRDFGVYRADGSAQMAQ